MLKAFQTPAGVQFQPTKAEDAVLWREANMIRWGETGMAPFGGWSQISIGETASPVRQIHTWEDVSGGKWTAYLCDGHCYVEFEGALLLISPVDMVAPSTDFLAGGFGDGPFGDDAFGTPRPVRTDRKALGYAFSIDNWGENLVFMTSIDQRLLMWDPNTPTTKATQVATSPTGRCFVVTPERFVQIFDYDGNIGEFAWCDQEDITNWNFADVLSKAGTLPYEPRRKVTTAKAIDSGTIMFTTSQPYLIQYIGMPLIFSIEPIKGGTVPTSAQSLFETPDGVMWPSDSGWWIYNGVSVAPVACPIWNWIDTKIDWDIARFTATIVDNTWFSEMWWFFPPVAGSKNTYCAVFNYRDGWWSMAKISRSGGSRSNYVDYPLMADDTKIYRHESGLQYSGAPDKPWIESHVLNVDRGAAMMTFRQVMPEIEGAYANLRYSLAFKYKRTPSAEVYTPQRSIQQNGFVDFVQTGRDFRLRIETTVLSADRWTIGQSLLDIVGRGKKP